MRSTRKYAAMTTATAAALILAACGGGSSGSGSSTNGSTGSAGPVTMSWWNNATANPLKAVYLEAIKLSHNAPESFGD